MQKIHMEFDLVVTDWDAKDLLGTPEISLQDNIMDALEIYDECEKIENFKMYKVEKEL